MIPTKTEKVEVFSTFEGESIEMGMDQSALQHIIDRLVEAYSNVEKGVIRELANNALDSHIEAGNNAPIEVILPKDFDVSATSYQPFLKIKDQGIGLNVEDIRQVFSLYGASTKRHSNQYTGSMGIGSKSPLAYTTQYTVRAVKDGIATTVVVSKDEEGVGRMNVMDESEVNEPNGVEISVPAKKGNTFEENARDLFKFWAPGTVLLDGEEPEKLTEQQENISITDDIRMYRLPIRDQFNNRIYENLNPTNYVVMGHVPYPVDSAEFNMGMPEGTFLVAHVPNGTMHFSLSREQLRYTDKTVAVLKDVKQRYKDGLVASVKREIHNASDKAAALTVLLRWRQSLPRLLQDQTFDYRGLGMPDTIQAPGASQFIVARGKPQFEYRAGYNKPTKVGAHSHHSSINLHMVTDAIWVYGFKRSFTPACKKKLWMHCDMNSIDYPENFIMCQKKPNSAWIDPSRIWKWEPIEALKLPRTTTTKNSQAYVSRIPGSYDVIINGVDDMETFEDVPGDDIDTDNPIYYYEGRLSIAQYRAQKLAKLEDNFTVVPLTANRIGKFKRLFPDAKPLESQVQEYFISWKESLTDFEKEWLSAREAQRERRYVLPRRGIKDPHIAKVQYLLTIDKPDLSATVQAFSNLGYHAKFDWHDPLDTEKYPLYEDYAYGRAIQRKLKRHNLIYINAVYEAENS